MLFTCCFLSCQVISASWTTTVVRTTRVRMAPTVPMSGRQNKQPAGGRTTVAHVRQERNSTTAPAYVRTALCTAVLSCLVNILANTPNE